MNPTEMPSGGAATPGLPPVTPPSGRFIAQLFLVPGLIVLVAVLIVLAANYLLIGGYTPEYFLNRLDSDNADIRWRGASDLAQHIKRTDSKLLKADTKFALDLAERLRTALADLTQLEQAMAKKVAELPPVSRDAKSSERSGEQPPVSRDAKSSERSGVASEQDAAWRKLAPQRNFVEYLASALGDFYSPVGVPLLCEIIEREEAPDAKGNTMRRRRAIWALSNLGANLRTIDKQLTAEQRAKIMDDLKQEMAGTKEWRAAWAATALYYLDKSAVAASTPVVLVDRALAKCSRTPDRYLRELVANSLNFWDGDLVEETLLRLSRDDGFGTLIRVADGD
jgi:hypothetical protein